MLMNEDEKIARNTRLITAAPEMYALLNELSKEHETMATVLLKQKARELLARIGDTDNE